MDEFPAAYDATDDRNERYRLLRRELSRLRDAAEAGDFPDREAVVDTVRSLAGRVDGSLLVFAANDFGGPLAFRPAGTPVDLQNELRDAILERKYATDAELDDCRRALLSAHPGVHKAIVAAHDGDAVRYHLPEGSDAATNFLTVREMVGFVDYVTNSDQQPDLCHTY